MVRYGGEEFAVILPNTSREGLQVFAERLRRQVADHDFAAGGMKIQLTISLGGTTFCGTENGRDRLDLIDAADRALYQSKSRGRNQATILD